jgi:hypothetical protein
MILSGPPGQREFGTLLTDYSGVHHKGIRLSFGRKSGASISTPNLGLKDQHVREIKIKLDPLDYPVLGTMMISDVAIPNHTSAIQRFNTIGFVHPGNNPFTWTGLDWFGTWGQRPWEDSGFIDLGIRQLRYHCFKESIPYPDADKRRHAFYTFKTDIDDIDSLHTQSRYFTLKDTLPFDDGDNSGIRIIKYTTLTSQIPGQSSDKSRFTTITRGADIDPPDSTSTQMRTHSMKDSILKESAGVQRYTSYSYPAQYTGVTGSTNIQKEIMIQGECPEDTNNPPRISNTHLVSSQLKQTNGMPLFSAGSNWFGKWNDRTWASPLFTNIGVIHGNTN